MEFSRQVFAAVDLATSLVGCGLWWFAFTRIRGVGPILVLAITHTVGVVSSIENVLLAFTERLLIPIANSNYLLVYFTALSYVGMIIRVVELIAYVLLVKWIIQQVRPAQDNDTLA